jgi:hypothetical protein
MVATLTNASRLVEQLTVENIQPSECIVFPVHFIKITNITYIRAYWRAV